MGRDDNVEQAMSRTFVSGAGQRHIAHRISACFVFLVENVGFGATLEWEIPGHGSLAVVGLGHQAHDHVLQAANVVTAIRLHLTCRRLLFGWARLFRVN